MTFRAKVGKTRGLSQSYCKGLGALAKLDRARIRATPTGALSGSVDIDSALRASLPQAARWDYAVGWRENAVYWIEVHPASGGGAVQEVIAKLEWLTSWLSGDGRELASSPGFFVWIASGKSSFAKNAPQLRQLSSRGLVFAGSHLKIPLS